MKRILFPILLLALTGTLFAQDEERTARIIRISKQSGTIFGDRGGLVVPSVETLNKNQFSFGVGLNNIDRTPRDLDINSVPIFFSYGLTGRLTVTATIEAQRQIAARNLSQNGFFNTLPFVKDPFVKGFGDTIITGKYRIQRRQGSLGGISLSGFVKIPHADATAGLGSGKVDGGIELVFTSSLPLQFLLNSSMGLVSTSDAELPVPITLKDELRSGIGLIWPAGGIGIYGGGIVQGIFEYSTVTFIGAGSPNDVIQAPSDLVFGFRYLRLNRGITFSGGYRRNSNFDREFPGNSESDGFVFGITYTKPVEPVLTNNFPLIVLEVEQAAIPVGGSVQVTAVAFDADSDPLTYAWTSSAGQVVGTGETVTFDASGLTPGDYVVRAVANDGRGGTSQSEVTITVQ